MSALRWHAEAAKHLSKAFRVEADRAAECLEYPDTRLLIRFSLAYGGAANSIMEELRAPLLSGEVERRPGNG